MGALILLIIIIGVGLLIDPVITWLLIGLVVVIAVWCTIATNNQDQKIVSAEVIERIQVTKEVCRESGFSLGWNGNPRMYWSIDDVPSHVEAKVSVVYEDGKRRVLTLTEGSNRYKRIMSICQKRKEVPCEVVPTVNKVKEPKATKATKAKEPEVPKVKEPEVSKVDYIDVKTNQLAAGVYVIGELIPEGTYDLRWVWGSGSVHKYVDNTTLLGANNLFQWVGNTHDYEQRVLVNVVCKKGEYLHIQGNLIVEIRKSKPIELDL